MHATATPTHDAKAVPKWQLISFYAVVGLFTALLVFVAYTPLSLLVQAAFGQYDFGVHWVHDVVAMSLVVAMLALVLTQLRGAIKRPLATTAVFLMGLTFTLVILAGGSPIGQFVPLIILAAAAMSLHPARRYAWRPLGTPRVALLALGAIALAVAAPYAIDQIQIERGASPLDAHSEFDHYASMGAVALAIPVIAILAGLGAPGWRVVATTSAIVALVWSVMSFARSDLPGALATTWAALAGVWGIAALAATWWPPLADRTMRRETAN